MILQLVKRSLGVKDIAAMFGPLPIGTQCIKLICSSLCPAVNLQADIATCVPAGANP